MTSSSCIPSDAYLYKPQDSDIKADGQRLIFDGNVQFDEKESKAVSQFRLYAARNHYTLKPFWNDNKVLRFLQASGFKNEKALTSISNYTSWRESKLPINIDQKLEEFLNSGFLYVHGRDHKFRPIVVFNVNQIDPKNFDFELIINALTFWFEYVIDEWMLPGQVENWIFITNLKGMGLSHMANQSVRKLFVYLQENYKCRLYKMYLINAPSSVYVPWSIAKKFLDGDTVEKVNFCKSQAPSDLFTHTNRSQVEEKFGGSAPNATQFWPPIVPSNDYFVSSSDAKNLMSKEEYIKLYKNDGLKDLKINQSLIEEELNRSSTKGCFITADNTPESSDIGSYTSLPAVALGDLEVDFMIEDLNEYTENNSRISIIRDFGASFLSRFEAR